MVKEQCYCTLIDSSFYKNRVWLQFAPSLAPIRPPRVTAESLGALERESLLPLSHIYLSAKSIIGSSVRVKGFMVMPIFFSLTKCML